MLLELIRSHCFTSGFPHIFLGLASCGQILLLLGVVALPSVLNVSGVVALPLYFLAAHHYPYDCGPAEEASC